MQEYVDALYTKVVLFYTESLLLGLLGGSTLDMVGGSGPHPVKAAAKSAESRQPSKNNEVWSYHR